MNEICSRYYSAIKNNSYVSKYVLNLKYFRFLYEILKINNSLLDVFFLFLTGWEKIVRGG